MKKLDDIPKTNIFEVPDGYFDQLALQIQSKTERLSPVRKSAVTLTYALRYAIPSLLIVFATIYLYKINTIKTTEELLASIPSEHLIAYLHESDINEQDLLEAIKFDSQDADSINMHVQTKFLFEEVEFDEFKKALENEL